MIDDAVFEADHVLQHGEHAVLFGGKADEHQAVLFLVTKRR